MSNPEILDLPYFQQQLIADMAVPHPTIPVVVASGQYILGGTVIGIKTADGKAYPYNSGNSDGTQTPVGILAFTVNSSSTLQGSFFPQFKDVLVDSYMGGAFFTSALTGLDGTAITDLKGMSWPNGVFKF